MNYRGLEEAYKRYREDPDTANELFSVCLEEAKRQTCKLAWGHDNHIDRESVTQECVIAVFLALPTLKPHIIFSWWFLGIVRNKCSDAIRLMFTRNEHALATDYAGTNEWESSYDRLTEAAGANIQLIDHLIQDYDIASAAEELGISQGAAKQRIQQIKKRSHVAK